MMNAQETSYRIETMIPSDVKTVVIVGHIRPDGDCVGSCLGLYHYLKENMPRLEVEICLQKFSESFQLLPEIGHIRLMEEMKEADWNRSFDLCISCDASDRARLGDAVRLLDQAKHTICIDHHITNPGFAQVNYIQGHLSSCAETLGQLLDMEKINRDCAECLYLGVAHDTGVFKYSNTTFQTMCFAGHLMEKGINHTEIIDRTYFGRTKAQTLICGKAMYSMKTAADGKIAYTRVTLQDMEECGADHRDLNGIVDQVRIVEGAEAGVFIYEMEDGRHKVSLRSNELVDVSRIAASHGGGGHVRAAGFDISMEYEELIAMILEEIQSQLNEMM